MAPRHREQGGRRLPIAAAVATCEPDVSSLQLLGFSSIALPGPDGPHLGAPDAPTRGPSLARYELLQHPLRSTRYQRRDDTPVRTAIGRARDAAIATPDPTNVGARPTR